MQPRFVAVVAAVLSLFAVLPAHAARVSANFCPSVAIVDRAGNLSRVDGLVFDARLDLRTGTAVLLEQFLVTSPVHVIVVKPQDHQLHFVACVTVASATEVRLDGGWGLIYANGPGGITIAALNTGTGVVRQLPALPGHLFGAAVQENTAYVVGQIPVHGGYRKRVSVIDLRSGKAAKTIMWGKPAPLDAKEHPVYVTGHWLLIDENFGKYLPVTAIDLTSQVVESKPIAGPLARESATGDIAGFLPTDKVTNAVVQGVVIFHPDGSLSRFLFRDKTRPFAIAVSGSQVAYVGMRAHRPMFASVIPSAAPYEPILPRGRDVTTIFLVHTGTYGFAVGLQYADGKSMAWLVGDPKDPNLSKPINGFLGALIPDADGSAYVIVVTPRGNGLVTSSIVLLTPKRATVG